MKSKILLVTFLFASIFPSLKAQALISPVGLSLVSPVEFPKPDGTVAGLRLNIIRGNHDSVYGFDFGALINSTKKEFVGIQVAGLANTNNGNTTILGLQAALVGNYNKGNDCVLYGLQLGVINVTYGLVAGVQVGLVNKAENVYGLQIGLVNQALSLHGVQLGLLNFNKSGLPFFPAINIGF